MPSLHQSKDRHTGSDPRVSVLISVYNAGRYLRPALQSILDQSYRNLEVIVIDDGSSDGCIATIEDVRDPRVRLLRQANAGKSVALNCALAEASGEFYAIQDADDLSYPRRIEVQVRCMLENPKIAACFTGNDLLIDDRPFAPRTRAKDVGECARDIAFMRMPAHDPTVMYRLSMVRDHQYDPELRIGQGYDYILRVGEQLPMRVIGECLYSYRVRGESVTRRDPARRMQQMRRLLEKACERRGLDPARVFSWYRAPQAARRNQDLDNNIAGHLIESVIDQKRQGQLPGAFRAAWFCLALHPLDPHYYKALVYALAPLTLIDLYRRGSRASL